MKKIKYDINIMKYMSLFESITKAKLKDCILDGNLTFIVQEGYLGKAVGKNGSKVKMLEKVINKKIRMIEFNDNVLEFVKNLVYPVKLNNIEQQDGILTMKANDTKSRGMLIGRDKVNLIRLKDTVKRYFDVEEIKVM